LLFTSTDKVQLELKEPNLLGRPNNTAVELRKFVLQLTPVGPNEPGWVTTLRTSQNESLHHRKLVRLPKYLDLWQAYEALVRFTALIHNDGDEEGRTILARAFKFNKEDTATEAYQRIVDRRAAHRRRVLETINKRNVERQERVEDMLARKSAVDLVSFLLLCFLLCVHPRVRLVQLFLLVCK